MSGGSPGPHKIQGLGALYLKIMDMSLVDEDDGQQRPGHGDGAPVSREEDLGLRRSGLFAWYSSGAARSWWCCRYHERYLSTELPYGKYTGRPILFFPFPLRETENPGNGLFSDPSVPGH